MSTSEIMPKSSPSQDLEPPLYVRWTPELCPYALEMRLDLITSLKTELAQADASRVEISGVFVGLLPTPGSPTLRLDELVFVPPNPDATVEKWAMLDEITSKARYSERPVVGFVRSHLEATPMVPSELDVALLARQFPEGIFAFMLVDPTPPAKGAFYLAMSGDMPDDSSTPIFPLDETPFRSLPQLPAEATEDVRNFGFGRQRVRRPTPWAAVASLALLVILVCSWTFGGRIAQLFRPDSNQIDLNVSAAGSNLKITWDHTAPAVSRALSATVLIVDGGSQREVKLDSDDLRLGQVAYERLSKKVYVVMRLKGPGMKLPPQTFDWMGD